MTMPTPEWQDRILARYKANPEESVAERAAALGVSAFWLQMVSNTDAFRELLVREGLVAGAQQQDLQLRSTDHLFAIPSAPAAAEGELQEVSKENFGPKTNPAPFTGQKPMDWSHEGLIDYMIAHPECTKGQIAEHFGMSKGWTYRLLASAAFQEALAKRKDKIIDPQLRASVEETMNSIIFAGSDLVHQRIANGDVRTTLRAMDIAAKLLGGSMRQPQVAVHNYVAVVPPKLATAEEWSQQYQARVLENK